MKIGKFIVIYGTNNLGKTTQAKLLVERFKNMGEKAEHIKYPIYDLRPTGVILNDYLRGDNMHNLTPREAQIFYAKNRAQYEEELKKKLKSGTHIIAEDYTGTGLAWGMGTGIDEMFLKFINSHLLKEDIAFLFDGEIFSESIEKNHKHETDHELTKKVRTIHLRLGEQLGWIKINANQTIPQVHKDLWEKALRAMKDDNAPPPDHANASPAPVRQTPQYLRAADNHTLLPGETTRIKIVEKIIIPKGQAGLIIGSKKIGGNDFCVLGELLDYEHDDKAEEDTVLIKSISQDIVNIEKNRVLAKFLF